jgi:hypothetical protein
MKKLLLASSILALVSAPAFAAGNLNIAGTGQIGFGNSSHVTQGGNHNVNVALTGQAGAFNRSTVSQGGNHNANFAGTLQFGVGNSSSITQN